MIRKICFAVCAWVVVLANGYAETQPEITNPSTPILVAPDNPIFTISMYTDASSTGYLWYRSGMHSPDVKPLGMSYIPPDEKKGTMGKIIWNFRVMSNGFQLPSAYELRFEQRRTWETEPIKSQKYVILTDHRREDSAWIKNKIGKLVTS